MPFHAVIFARMAAHLGTAAADRSDPPQGAGDASTGSNPAAADRPLAVR